MKLNYKRTIMVGFAFFLICSFWQAYDNTISVNSFSRLKTNNSIFCSIPVVAISSTTVES